MAGRNLAQTISLVEATAADRVMLDHLAQLYQYDFSEFTGSDIGSDGRFGWVDIGDLLAQTDSHAYLINVDGRIAGFAIAYRDTAFRDPNETTWWMAEFFVMRSYRRRGVGKRVAVEMFDNLGGTWEVGQMRENFAAQAFWRSVIGSYTGGSYEEFEMSTGRWSGPVQYFRARSER